MRVCLDQAVPDHGALVDEYAAAYDGIFDGTANFTAVGDERIFDGGSLFVLNGDFVLDLGENGAFGIHEEFFPNIGIEAVFIGGVVAHG